MLDAATLTPLEEMHILDREREEQFTDYLRDQLAQVQAKRRRPQTRDDHAMFAAREAHFLNLLEARQ